eukprot:Awhi_evm1s3850
MACLKNSESCVDVILNDSKDIDFKVVNLMGQTPYQLHQYNNNNNDDNYDNIKSNKNVNNIDYISNHNDSSDK